MQLPNGPKTNSNGKLKKNIKRKRLGGKKGANNKNKLIRDWILGDQQIVWAKMRGFDWWPAKVRI